jgi:hypothetical protein
LLVDVVLARLTGRVSREAGAGSRLTVALVVADLATLKGWALREADVGWRWLATVPVGVDPVSLSGPAS